MDSRDNAILSGVRKALADAVNPKVRDGFQRFFKEEVRYYGVSVPKVKKIAKEHYPEIRDMEKKETFAICEELLKSSYTEEAFIAYEWAYRLRGKYEPADFAVFESWAEKYVSNWAECDTLCNHCVGSFLEKYPEYVKELYGWARSDNRWMRRAASVSLVLPARKGLFLKDVFGIADILLEDTDDLVQKGYGWMLKEASKARQKDVYDYVMRNRKRMPRTALRYAIEKMPEELRKKAMER